MTVPATPKTAKEIRELRKLSIQERTPANDKKIFDHLLRLLSSYEEEIGPIEIGKEKGDTDAG